MTMEINGRPIFETDISCLYQLFEKLPNIYPALTNGGVTAVAGHASANTWGNYVDILPALTIDADPSQTYFDISAIDVTGITNNSVLYFEFQYNSITVGRGYYAYSGTGSNLTRNSAFKMIPIKKVAGQALKMRIMSNQAGESIDINPILWCEGNP